MDKSTCCTCGFQWRTGFPGDHSCATVLNGRVFRLREALINAKQAIQKVADAPLSMERRFADDGINAINAVLNAEK